jgi:hypothetical protein
MNNSPAFFIPSKRKINSEDLYLRIKSYAQSQFPNQPITDRRIFKVISEHNGDIKTPKYEIEVGRPINEKGETVIAVFETSGWYLVCTKRRGALVGHPHCVCGQDVVEVVEFQLIGTILESA